MDIGGQRAVEHRPVMLAEALQYLHIAPEGVYVDATVGPGGHSEAILGQLGPGGRLICIDRDGQVLMEAQQRLSDERCEFHKAVFSGLSDVLGDTKVNGVLMDLGVSMLQLKGEGRGFSFAGDDPLDMRMDMSQALTAERVVNTYPEKELRRILLEYGEERLAGRIARRIVAKRPLHTCRDLTDAIWTAYGGKRGRTHPSTRTFQAIRIEVNSEMDELKSGLEAASEALLKGGRLVVVSYHSLEDRAVKVFMREAKRTGILNVLTKKPLVPERAEIRGNPSARSAKMRAGEAL